MVDWEKIVELGLQLVAIFLLGVLALVIYTVFFAPPQAPVMAGTFLTVVKNCDDRVICYQTLNPREGLQCFRDADLVAEYCDICHGNPNCAPATVSPTSINERENIIERENLIWQPTATIYPEVANLTLYFCWNKTNMYFSNSSCECENDPIDSCKIPIQNITISYHTHEDGSYIEHEVSR